MRPRQALQELTALREAVREPAVRRSTPEHKAWKAKVDAVISRALGETSAVLKQFRDMSYHVGIWTGSPGEDERDARYFAGRVDDAAGLIDAAIYELGLLEGDELIEEGSYDTGLWQHVRHSVEEERWEQVASQAVIYVEDKVRRWSGMPKDRDGKNLVGQALFAQAFAEGGPLALGQQANEATGWRNLGMGLVAALGNVDRHHIQERPDARQYALGVLGLTSLILTQIKHEHPESMIAGKS